MTHPQAPLSKSEEVKSISRKLSRTAWASTAPVVAVPGPFLESALMAAFSYYVAGFRV